MKSRALATLLYAICLAFVASSCSVLMPTLDIAEQVVASVRGITKTERTGDSISIIRTYPASVVTLHRGTNRTYTLKSQDKLSAAWLNDSTVTVFIEMIPDTITVRRK